MMIRSNLHIDDSMKFSVDYCETGSTLEFQNSVGSPLLTLTCIPPAMLVLLRDALSEEIAKGPRKSFFDKRK